MVALVGDPGVDIFPLNKDSISVCASLLFSLSQCQFVSVDPPFC